MQRWSVIIATRNRAEALAETLRRLPAPEGSGGFGDSGDSGDSGGSGGSGGPVAEVLIVDNGSSDGSAQAAARAWPGAQILRVRRNLGPAAKQLALERARFPLIAALDDDCAPAPWTWDQMARRFDADPSLACAGWGVCLSDGRWECAALPRAPVGAAVAFRRDALLAAGGYSLRLFMQAEEYDILFRLTAANSRCAVFHDMPALHRKSPLARSGPRTIYLDARNNIALIRRWAPQRWRRALAEDYAQRYLALGRRRACPAMASRGLHDGRAAQWLRPGDPLTTAQFDHLFGVTRIAHAMAQLRADGARRILFAPLGKNVLVYWRAAHEAGLEVVAVADDRFHAANLRNYRGAPVLTAEDAATLAFDAVVIANSAPIFAAEERDRWRARVGVEVVAPDAPEGPAAADYRDAPAAA